MRKKYPGYFFVLILSIVMSMSIGWQSEAKESKPSSEAKTEMSTKDSTQNSEKSVNTKVSSRSTSLKDVSTKPKKEWGDLQNLKEFSLNDDGVGIVAYNFGKSMEDIQELNGDEDAAKEMILYETGAVAYGLSGSKVIDVSEHIEVGDLGDLLSVASNDLAEHHIKLTVPSEYSGTGKELSTEIIIYTGKVAKVSTWDELDKAMKDKDVVVVDILKSLQSNILNFVSSRDNIKGSRIFLNDIQDRKKNIAILGNGHSIDFKKRVYQWYDHNENHKIIVDNLDMYGTDYYGPFSIRNTTGLGSTIIYRNINYTGSQITASYQAIMRFEGKNNIKSCNSYTSFDGTKNTSMNQNESGLEAHTLEFAESSDTSIEVENGDGVILGAKYSDADPVKSIQPRMTVERNANVMIETLGNSGESKNGNIYSVINLQRNGKVELQEGATVTTKTAENTIRIPVRMDFDDSLRRGNGWVTSINLGKNSRFIANSNGPIPSNRASIYLNNYSEINISEDAHFDVNANSMTTGAPVVSMGANSKINVEKDAHLNVHKDGGRGQILKLDKDSEFNVFDEGQAIFTSENETRSTDPMIYGGTGSNFIIGRKGHFSSKMLDGEGKRDMLQFDRNANFQFKDAKRVELDISGNPNANLINMASPGTFIADVQKVYAWSKNDASKVATLSEITEVSDEEDDEVKSATFKWNPMYGMVINYNRSRTIDVQANSISRKTREDFKENYRTENFSKILYTFIPDVSVALDEISDNRKLERGQKLTGVANNGAYIAFYKVLDEDKPETDILLTTPTVASPVEDDETKFHTTADNKGTYGFVLPKDVVLKAGDKIKAHAFLNGKTDEKIVTVQDNTPPVGKGVTFYESLNSTTPLPEKFVTNIKDTNPNNKSFTYQFNKDTPQEVVDGYMSDVGEHVVKVDVSDEAGNTTTIDAKLIVIKTNTNLTSKDLTISYKDLRTMSEDDIKQYILKNGKLEAYKLSDGQKEDVTPFISVKDLNGLTDLANIKSTPYNVSLVVPAKDAGTTEDILGEINVTVTDIDSVVTLKFVNEVDKVMDDYTTTIKAKVGDVIDLTKNETLIKQIAQLNKDGYLIDQDKRPEKESSFSVTDTEVVVTYKVYGTIQFQSVPTELDFGSVKYIARPNRVEKPTYDNNLVVRDTRSGQATGFRVTASITTPLQTKDGKQLQDVLRYVLSGKETILSEAEEPIYQIDTGKKGLHDISKNWSDKKESDGIKLQLGSSGDIHTGQYTGEITWKIMEGQP